MGIERDGSQIMRWVTDDGPRIPEPDRERIFQPYERAHTAPGVPASVGVGLTVSRELARAMGGRPAVPLGGSEPV